MLKIIQTTKFRPVNNKFLNDLNSDAKRIKDEKRLLVPADKTTNFYKMHPTAYNDLLEKNITKSYKHATEETAKKIKQEDREITVNLGIDDRVDVTANKQAFITLKDHKPNFANKPTCRLINPTKSEIGKISKQILDRINSKIIKATKINQWKNTSSVIAWFNALENKQSNNFISFDIVEFYPSITEDLLNQALDFASTYDNITPDERKIIIQAKNSLLTHKQQQWQKKNPTPFDVTMGSFDGAETCELVGCYLLTKLQARCKINVGLYRDDGLAAINASPRQTEKIKKTICLIFKEQGLNITIEANKKVVDFLDVTLNLNNSTYKPYTKPNANLLYVHKESNHPPLITENIPAGINRRLSSLSSDKESFDMAAPPYQKALDESGYAHTLQYLPQAENRKRKNRPRNHILWYNPPYSKSVSTNIGKRFLRLVERCFPKDNHLRKMFNKNTVKVSYSCMSSVKKIIDTQNKRKLKASQQKPTENTKPKQCNCRNKESCPMKGNCLQSAIIYQAIVKRKDNNECESYVGLTENEFKTRYNNHKASFRNKSLRNSTELSKYVWSLKDNNIDFEIAWQTIARAKPYCSANKRCNLCLTEKFIIIREPHRCTLNKRNELVSSCRHRGKALQRGK